MFHQQETILRTDPEFFFFWGGVSFEDQVIRVEPALEKRIAAQPAAPHRGHPCWDWRTEVRSTIAIAKRPELGLWDLPTVTSWLSRGPSIPRSLVVLSEPLWRRLTPLAHDHHPLSILVPWEDPGFRGALRVFYSLRNSGPLLLYRALC